MKLYEITRDLLDCLPRNGENLNKFHHNFTLFLALRFPDWMCKHYPEEMSLKMPASMVWHNPEYLCKHHPEQIADFHPLVVLQHNPSWMCNYNPRWVFETRPDIMAKYRPEWMAIHEKIAMFRFNLSWMIENCVETVKSEFPYVEEELYTYVEETFIYFKERAKK